MLVKHAGHFKPKKIWFIKNISLLPSLKIFYHKMFLLSLFFLTTYLKIRYVKKKYPSFPVRMKNSSSFEKNLLYFCNCCILLILKSYYLLLHEKEKKTIWLMNDEWSKVFKYWIRVEIQVSNTISCLVFIYFLLITFNTQSFPDLKCWRYMVPKGQCQKSGEPWALSAISLSLIRPSCLYLSRLLEEGNQTYHNHVCNIRTILE